EWLKQAQRLYQRGWEQSRRASAYLGINAASTSVLLGDIARGQLLARAVHDLLEKRRKSLAGLSLDTGLELNYWDSVSLAEAHLTPGEDDKARSLYNQAFTRYKHDQGSIGVTRDQLALLLPRLGKTETVDAFLAGPGAP